VALPEPAGIGGRDETLRQRALTEETFEALECGGSLLRDLDPQAFGGRRQALRLERPCFT
jgi:hypothetical protein